MTDVIAGHELTELTLGERVLPKSHRHSSRDRGDRQDEHLAKQSPALTDDLAIQIPVSLAEINVVETYLAQHLDALLSQDEGDLAVCDEALSTS